MITFQEALRIAQDKYPHKINHYEEYEKYYVFEREIGVEHVGGEYSPIVVRKSDGELLNYAPIFFNFDAEAENVGEILSEGYI